jgi:hypothetical protein
MATKQELFETVINHLAKQKAQALDDNYDCAYRGEGDTKCAVGCLIDDEYYSEDLEGQGAHVLAVQLAVKHSVGMVSDQAFEMLNELQTFHDRFYQAPNIAIGDRKAKLKSICERYSVKLPKGTEDMSWV